MICLFPEVMWFSLAIAVLLDTSTIYWVDAEVNSWVPFFPRSTSLSLKTPFADVQTEKRGLQRRVSNRRKITEQDFGAAVNRIEMGGEYDYWNICESTFFVGFTIVSIKNQQSCGCFCIF